MGSLDKSPRTSRVSPWGQAPCLQGYRRVAGWEVGRANEICREDLFGEGIGSEGPTVTLPLGSAPEDHREPSLHP